MIAAIIPAKVRTRPITSIGSRLLPANGSADCPTSLSSATAQKPTFTYTQPGNYTVQVSDTGAIEQFCEQVIAANPGPVADYKAGKTAALNSLKGQVMKLSKGKANPALVGEILERKLKGN